MKHKQDVIDEAWKSYGDPDALLLYQNSTVNEQRAYMKVRGRVIAVRPRILEIIKFAEMMGWKKLGVAFCVGLGAEAKRVTEIFESAGLDVYSVCCKCGSVDKAEWGIAGADKINALRGKPDRFEAGCNPIAQAELLSGPQRDRRSLHRPRYPVHGVLCWSGNYPDRQGQGHRA